MVLEYSDQSIKNLEFLFFIDSVEIKDYFKVIKQNKRSIGLGSLTVSIVGESHTIQFKNNHIYFTEIVAGVKNKHLYKLCKKNYSVKNIKKDLRFKYKNQYLDYNFRLRKEKQPPSVIYELLSKINDDSSNTKLLFIWPNPGAGTADHAVSAPSFTYINYNLQGDNLIKFNTLHFYKNELLSVSTSSDIEIK